MRYKDNLQELKARQQDLANSQKLINNVIQYSQNEVILSNLIQADSLINDAMHLLGYYGDREIAT